MQRIKHRVTVLKFSNQIGELVFSQYKVVLKSEEMKKDANQSRRVRTAYHEAGHAIAYMATKEKFKYVTIKPDEDTFGHLMPHFKGKGEMYYYNMRLEKLFGEFTRYYAGPIAESIYMGRKSHIGASGDYRNISEFALRYFGQDSKMMQHFLKFIRLYTEGILRNRWNEVEKLANELVIKETLTMEEVQKLLYPDLYAIMMKLKK